MLYVQAVGEKGVKVVSTDSPKSKAFPFTALCELRKKGVRGIFKREDGKLFAVPMTPVKAGGVKYFGKKIAPSEYAGLVWKDTLSSVSQSRFKQYKGVYARGAERPNTFCVDSVGVDGSWMPQVTNLAFGTIPCILVSENTGTKAHMLYPERVPSINSYLDAWVGNNKVQLVNAHCEYDSELNMFKVPKELHDNFYITLPKSPLQLDEDERASKRLSYYSGNVIMEYTVEDLRRVGLDAKYILCSLDIDKRGNQGVLSCWVTDRGSTELVTLPDIVYDLRAMASQGETNARVRKYYPDIEIRGNTLVMTCMQGTFTFDIDALLQDNTNAMDMGSAGVSGLGKVLTTPVVAGVGTTSVPAGIGMPSVSLLSPDEVTVDGSDGITYKVDEEKGVAYVKSASKSLTVANIESEYKGYRVASVGFSAFDFCTSLTSVTIPDSVTYICRCAFTHCISLTSVTIPDSVTSIDEGAFYGCTSLTAVTIPSSVTSIGSSAFGAYFDNNDHRRKKMDNFTIYGYRGSEAEVYANKDGFKFVALDGDEITYETDEKKGVAYVMCAPESLTVANIKSEYKGYRVTSIGDSAFEYCTSLTSVTIPDSVTSIGCEAFRCCTSLTEITIGGSVTHIDKGAFYNCTSLTEITIPDSVTSIGEQAFRDCTSLTSVTIPDSVTYIDASAFYECTSLTSVTIPDSVTHIDIEAFGYYLDENWYTQKVDNFTIYGYRGTEAETYANKNEFKFVALDGDEIVYRINEEKGVAYVKSAPKSLTVANIKSEYKGYPVTWIGVDAFKGCTSLTSVTIPSSVTRVGWCAFKGCTSLTTVTIPDSVTSIDTGAFVHCTSLTEVTIPDSVTSIGYGAFRNCTSLTSVTIPDSVTSIGGLAFSGCKSLTSVIIPDSVTSIDRNAFGYVATPKGDRYVKAPDFTIYGYTGTEAETYANKNEIKFVSLDDRSSDTDDGIVYGVDERKGVAYVKTVDKSITVANILLEVDGYPVTWIGEEAFKGCTSLTSVTIPDSVTSIGRYAFKGCTSLTSVTIPDSVTRIRSLAFSGCTSLTAVTIPDSVTFIGGWAFYGCTSLTTITIPDSLTSIGGLAFSGCTSLTAVIIPDSVTFIGGYAFDGCTSLTSVTIPDSVTSIGKWAFDNCTSLTEVTIPDSVTNIDEGAFGYVANPKGEGRVKAPDFTIYGYRGTEAEVYANKNEIKFVALGDRS